MSKYPQHDEVENFSGSDPVEGPIEEKDIYENGKLLKISIEDLENNQVAIKQLINSNNTTKKELHAVKAANKSKDVEIGLLKVSPFIAIIALILNAIATTILAIGVNYLTSQTNHDTGVLLITLGIIGASLGNIATIIYPWVTKWIKK